MTGKWNLIVHVACCDNGRLCFLAIRDEFVGNTFPGYSAAQPEQEHRWLNVRRRKRGTYPLMEAMPGDESRYLGVMKLAAT